MYIYYNLDTAMAIKVHSSHSVPKKPLISVHTSNFLILGNVLAQEYAGHIIGLLDIPPYTPRFLLFT